LHDRGLPTRRTQNPLRMLGAPLTRQRSITPKEWAAIYAEIRAKWRLANKQPMHADAEAYQRLQDVWRARVERDRARDARKAGAA
jgi:hypothetical protein